LNLPHSQQASLHLPEREGSAKLALNKNVLLVELLHQLIQVEEKLREHPDLVL